MISRDAVHELNNEIAKVSGLCRMLEISFKKVEMTDEVKLTLTEKIKLAQALLLKLSERIQEIAKESDHS